MTKDLIAKGPVVVNIGVGDFAISLEQQGAKVIQVKWSPPRTLRPDLAELLERLGA